MACSKAGKHIFVKEATALLGFGGFKFFQKVTATCVPGWLIYILGPAKNTAKHQWIELREGLQKGRVPFIEKNESE